MCSIGDRRCLIVLIGGGIRKPLVAEALYPPYGPHLSSKLSPLPSLCAEGGALPVPAHRARPTSPTRGVRCGYYLWGTNEPRLGGNTTPSPMAGLAPTTLPNPFSVIFIGSTILLKLT
jgi:hypothetical protein